jgi:hypothetical protein
MAYGSDYQRYAICHLRALRLTRRQALKWGLAGSAAVVLPRGLMGCGESTQPAPVPTPGATPIPSFLTDDEQRTLTAMTGRIIPTDTMPGAIEAGVAEYINRLLSTVPSSDDPAGNVFAGGPFSNRNPFPDAQTGTPSTQFPPDDFAQFIPLTRLQLMSWRVQLLGTAAVPGSDFNAGVQPPIIGIREHYRTGLAAIAATSQKMFGADFAGLSAAQQDAVMAAVDSSFIDLVTGHTIEGMFCAPEYGGNKDRVGWQLIGYDGDSQPLGYSVFDTTTQSYNERPDKPNSTANPDEDFSGVDAETAQFLTILARVGGGPHFP